MQNPRSAFNPLYTMATHARETCRATGQPAEDAALIAAMTAVGLENPSQLLKRYPFEMSGGMLQRMMIALALLSKAPFIFADEPTTDLDAVAQGRILDLLEEIVTSRGQGLLLVTHDMGVVARLGARGRGDGPRAHRRALRRQHPVQRSPASGESTAAGGAPGAVRNGVCRMNLLNVTDVSHDYPHHPGVLRDVSLNVQAGENGGAAWTQRLR